MRAFLWTATSGMTDLGVLPGAASSGGRGINSFGHVVGWSGAGPVAGEAVRHVGAGLERIHDDLSAEDAFAWSTLSMGQAVNDRGEIAGHGNFRGNGNWATPYRLVPTDYRPYGTGCAGRNAKVAALTGVGRRVPGGGIAFLVAGTPLAPATLLVGAAPAELPLPGGCSVLIAPPWVDSGGFVLDGRGTARLPFTFPSSLGLGSVFLQAVVFDNASPNGVLTTSNGVELRLR